MTSGQNRAIHAGADAVLVNTPSYYKPAMTHAALVKTLLRQLRAAVEPEIGDFAVTVARLLIFASYRLALLQRLAASRDPVLAAIAAKSVHEVTYHRDYAARWFLTLARGTEESRRRLIAGLALVWPLHDELFRTHPIEDAVSREGIGVDPADVAAEVARVLDEVLTASGMERPAVPPTGAVSGGMGRDGRHTEAMGPLLAEMQVVARAHPSGRW